MIANTGGGECDVREAARAITERHDVIAGTIWLDQMPIRSIEHVRCAVDPEGVWITLRPGRDYGIVDAEHGQLYVSALVGTLVEVTYTMQDRTTTAVSQMGLGHAVYEQ